MQHPALGYRERAVADSYTPGTVHGAAHGLSGALLLRVKPEQFRQGFRLYSATFLVMLMIIACRITFVPDKLMVLLFPPILLLIVVWQLCCCIWVSGKATSIDSTLGWVSLAVYLVAFIFAFVGYTFVALLILVWWYFLLAVWLTVVCVLDLMNRYKERWLDKRVEAMRNRITYVSGEDRESLLFGATWFYDFIRQVAVPTILLLSLPMCVRLSLSMFDFDDLFVKFYENPFIQLYENSGFETLRISARSIIWLLILYYVLRYFSKAIHAIWQYVRYAAFMRKHNRTTIRANEINLSLGNSIISVLIWMGFAMVVIYIWKIPTGSLGLIAGGLSAGIGLALKDVINNFIYGIQLMGGRLRVGDWIECDGVRGKVTAINYQCVQAETIEGTEMSFLNSSLFGKNFNNLTRNNSYELTIVTVGVAYGTEIQRVREVLVEGMQKMRTKDQYGRDIVDPNYGFNVVVGNMSDSAVDINVKQMVLVAERVAYFDRAKEAIYDALTAAGITIAFPQCDVHLIQEE
jgi:small-conductance mechanosensitive channel